jgi:pilus assembly protein CpaB
VRRRTIAIIGALVLALIAAGLVVWYVSSLKQEKAPVVVTKPVVVAVANIPARTTGEEMVANGLVKQQDVPETSISAGAVTDLATLKGMVLSVPIVSGQQLLQTQLAEPATQALSFRLKQGMRAITIGIDPHNAVGGQIQEGDRVDVIATFKSDDFQTATMPIGSALSPTEVARLQALTGLDLTKIISPVSITILQQAEVLGIDLLQPASTVTTQATSGGLFTNSGTSGSSSAQKLPENPVITLMVTPADAEKLAYAQEFGSVYFTLVPTSDTTKVTTEGVALPNILR